MKDALTGGEKGSKPERFDLMPVEALKEVARVYGYGAQKYALRNWEKGYDWGLSIAALERHIAEFKNRHSFDDESGKHHLAHAVFHCLALMTWEANGKGTDSRTQLNADIRPRLEFKGIPLEFDETMPQGVIEVRMPKYLGTLTPEGLIPPRHQSAQACGCDPGCKPCGWTCEDHREEPNGPCS